jgi:SAM-dependent methyltransferase
VSWRRRRRRAALWRTTPVSCAFGLDRGTTIRRRYIEQFLDAHSELIRGRVLEAGDDGYTRRFGGQRVGRSDVLNVEAGDPATTVVGNLETGVGIPEETFDSIVLTQTLHVVYELRAAVATVHRALRPGGTALVTIPTITQISRYDADRWGDYWRLTSQAADRLFREEFGADVEVCAYGNVLAAVASLHGLAAEELTAAELDLRDPDYEVLLGIRATRSGEGGQR